MKKNYGFEVCLNGNKLARAGIQKENYVVGCNIDAVHRKDGSEELHMSVSGLDSDVQMHVSWFGERIKIGDKISIEVINDQFDEPTSFGKKFTEEEIREQKMKHYFRLKEELKDYLDERC